MKPWLWYLLLGMLLAVVCDWRLKEPNPRERLTNALLSLCAWPLFAPLALLPNLVPRVAKESDASLRIKRALAEARAAVQGTPLAKLLSETMVNDLATTLEQVEARRAELSELLARPDFRYDPARGRPPKLQEESVARLWAIFERDRAALDELAELAESLRAQLLVARYSGRGGQELGPSSALGIAPLGCADGIGELAMELSARVESLNAWFELDGVHSRIAVGAQAADTRACP